MAMEAAPQDLQADFPSSGPDFYAKSEGGTCASVAGGDMICMEFIWRAPYAYSLKVSNNDK